MAKGIDVDDLDVYAPGGGGEREDERRTEVKRFVRHPREIRHPKTEQGNWWVSGVFVSERVDRQLEEERSELDEKMLEDMR